MKTKQIIYLPLKSVIADENQPRQYFDATKIASLANSIKRIGIKEPLVVEDMLDGTYKLIDGERRLRAATIAKLTEVPVLVEAKMDDKTRRIEQFHIQEQHEGWRPTEKAIAIRDIAQDFGLTMKEMGEMLSLSKEQMENYIAFINLVAHKEMVKFETPISMAPSIRAATNHAVRQMLAQENEDMTIEQQKAFQLGLIKRISTGEITKGTQITKVNDSVTQEAKQAINGIIKTDKSIEKLFVETNAKTAKTYRTFSNDVRHMLQSYDIFTRESVLVTTYAEDSELKAKTKNLIKKLQQLPS